jgi:acyl-coenzyme A synthetase/AMP-(fatty) acid ligase
VVHQGIGAGQDRHKGRQVTAQYPNVAVRVLNAAVKQRDQIAFVLPRRKLTYSQFRRLILTYAQHARKRGIGRDSLVAIDVDNPAMKSALTLACALIGAPWVDATPVVIRERALPYTHVLFGAAKNHKASPTQFLVDASWSRPQSGKLASRDSAGPEDVWNYAQSSGTTGKAKFMPVPHRIIEEGFARGFGTPEGQRVVASFLAPPGTAGITTYMVRVLAHGGTLVAVPNFGTMLKAGVNRVSGSPIQFTKLLQGAPKPERKIYAAQITGAAAAESLFALMLDFFEQVQIWYGTTEMGIVTERAIVSLPVDTSNVGTPLPTAEVALVDDNDQPVPAGTEGIVRIRRADRKGANYVGAEDVAKTIFRDGWFYPGDIGRFSEKGELHIVGRSDDRLNLSGVKVDAAGVDTIVQNVPGVRDGYCFEDRNEGGASFLSLLVELDEGMTLDSFINAFYRALNDSGLYYRVHRVYVTKDPPRTMTGKPVRRLAADYVRAQKAHKISLVPPKR